MFSKSDAQDYVSGLLQFDLAHGREPGTWYKFHNHVYGVGYLAQKLADVLEDIDSEKAWILGVMHDAGKIHERLEKRFHGLIGYDFFKGKDDEIARISLAHTFHFNHIPPYEKVEKMFFGRREDYNFVADFLAQHSANEYDKLIQMCDSLANCSGFVTLEQREEEFSQRYNMPVPDYMASGANLLKDYFDKRLGRDIYSFYSQLSSDFMLMPGNDYK